MMSTVIHCLMQSDIFLVIFFLSPSTFLGFYKFIIRHSHGRFNNWRNIFFYLTSFLPVYLSPTEFFKNWRMFRHQWYSKIIISSLGKVHLGCLLLKSADLNMHHLQSATLKKTALLCTRPLTHNYGVISFIEVFRKLLGKMWNKQWLKISSIAFQCL